MKEVSLLIGGLTLFLYGIDQMSKGLELLTGNKLQKILEKLTSNKIIGILVGALVTAIIQSSSSTTIIAVGFVNSKIISLAQAINLVIGANIGTTVTGLLLTLDIHLFAPILAFIGVIFQIFVKKRKYKYAGILLFGFGTLFMGMEIMGSALKPLANTTEFVQLIASAKNPIKGILIGALFTAVIQSSSATAGILITLANSGMLKFDAAFYLVLGTNIGTCVTSLLASIGASKNAKRVAIVHITFNIIGTIIFSLFTNFLPIMTWLASLSNKASEQIALMHTIFNITTTLFLLPFTDYLLKISKFIIRGEDLDKMDMKLMFINDNRFQDTLTSISAIRQEVIRMMECTTENFKLSIDNVITHNEKTEADIEYNEELIDFLHSHITKASVKTMTNDLNKFQYKQLSYFLKISSNLERIGDYSYNISQLTNQLYDNNLRFSEAGYEEIKMTVDELNSLFTEIIQSLKKDDFNMQKIRKSAFRIYDYIDQNKENYVSRLKIGNINPEAGLLYDKFYTYLSRVRDHLLNVANQYSTIYK